MSQPPSNEDLVRMLIKLQETDPAGFKMVMDGVAKMSEATNNGATAISEEDNKTEGGRSKRRNSLKKRKNPKSKRRPRRRR